MRDQGVRSHRPGGARLRKDARARLLAVVRVGEETLALSAGGFACAPPGVVHTFSNRSQAPVRFLNLATPAGFEHYMRDLSAVMAKGSPTSEEIGAIAARYDFNAV